MRNRVSPSRCRAALESLEPRRLLAVTAPLNPALPADLNGDGTVNSVDYGIMAAHWGKPASAATGDLNGDGIVDSRDFNAMSAEFGKAAEPPTDGGTTTPPVAGNWNMIFSEDFNTNPLQNGYVMNLWGKSESDGAGTNSTSNVTVSNGELSLTANRSGSSFLDGQIQSGGDLATGGHIQPKFGFKFGYIEARIDLPESHGLYDQFWMLPVPNANGFHDGDGEIDMLDNGTGITTSACGGSGVGSNVFRHDNYADLSGGYHTVGMDWAADHIDFYIDGKIVSKMHNTNVASIPQVAMYSILTSSVNDGQLWGPPPDASFQSDSMKVDYVRVWQQA